MSTVQHVPYPNYQNILPSYDLKITLRRGKGLLSECVCACVRQRECVRCGVCNMYVWYVYVMYMLCIHLVCMFSMWNAFPDKGPQALSASSQHELEGGTVQTCCVEKLHGAHFQQASL